MPIYGYRCTTCGHELEVLQKMSDSPLKTCPKCSGELQKLMYAAGVIFKGSGYYSTDYKSSAKGSDKSTSNGSESGSEDKSDAKTDSKTDSKPASESKSDSKSDTKTESKAAKSDSDS